MESGRSLDAWVLLAGAALLLAGGGLVLWEPFESSRPRDASMDSHAVSRTEHVPARLWQDPLSAVARWQGDKTDKDNGSPAQSSASFDIPADLKKLVVMPVLVHGGFYSESVEKRRRQRYAVLSATFAQDFRPTDPEFIRYRPIETDERDYDVAFEWLETNQVQYGGDVAELAGGNTVGDKAVRGRVLLLWLNEDQFGTDQLQGLRDLIAALVEELPPAHPLQEVDVNLIGPSGSTGLHNMIAEVSKFTVTPSTGTGNGKSFFPSYWNFSIYSPVATASAQLLLGDNEAAIRRKLRRSGDIEPAAASRNKEKCGHIDHCKHRYGNTRNHTSLFLMEEAFRQAGISFFRTIASDRTLLKKVINTEFRYRGIRPTDPDEAIVLISEWDTFYGRSLATAFMGNPDDADKPSGNADGNAGNAEGRPTRGEEEQTSSGSRQAADNVCQEENCRVYVYMRGLDGEIPAAKPSKDEQPAAAVDGPRQELERAAGVNRYDYLRRLAQDIREDFSHSSKTVRAVGVLGSDLYDKLLILQALRSEFPDALFFTTDTDARFLHPAETDWARGLVLASSYGLSLDQKRIEKHFCIKPAHRGHRRDLPPFRDSHQTSVCLAAQLALARAFGSAGKCETDDTADDVAAKPDTTIEKTTNGEMADEAESEPTDRPVTLDECRRIDDGKSDSDDRLRCTLAAFAAPKFFEVGISRLASLPQPRQSMVETMLESENVVSHRVWSYLLLAGAGVILLCVICAFLHPTRTRRVLASGLLAIAVAGGLTLLADHLDGVEGEPPPVFGGSSALPTVCLIWVTALLVVLLLIHLHFDLERISRRLARRFKLTKQAKWSRHLPRPREKPKGRSWPKHLRKRWIPEQRYLYLAVVHFGFSSLLVWVFSDFNPPIRGEVTYCLYVAGIFLAIFCFFVLTYFIVDEARRCGRMVRDLLSKKRWRGDSSLNEYVGARRAGIPVHDATRAALQRWRGVQYLAEKTENLEKIVYYPFAVLFLLILSHSPFIDNWRIVPSVAVVLATGIVVNVAGILLLRTYMGELRDATVSSLRAVRVDAQSTQHQALQTIIAEVGGERRGAFRPLGKDAILKAPLIPLGGYASLYLIEYFQTVMR